MFLAHCGTLLALAEKLVPDMLAAVGSRRPQYDRPGFLRLDEAAWLGIEPDSIDYAIMEKADNLAVFPFSGRWSDLGTGRR